MRPTALIALALIGCKSSTDTTDTDTVGDCLDVCTTPTDSDTDTDTDADSDTDSDTDADTDADTDPTGDTGATTPTGDTGPPPITTVSTVCVQAVQPLVFECTVTMSAPAPASLTFTSNGAPTRTFTSETPAIDHVITGWGLRPNTTYDWDAGDGVVGQVATGGVPQDLRGMTVNATGTLFGADAVLVYVKCGYFVIVDAEGHLVWYAETDIYDSFSDGMRWSQTDKSVLALTDSTMSFDTSEVQEIALTGVETLHLTTQDFDLDLTHDLDRWNGYTYLLGENGNGIGGFEVFQGNVKLGQWLLTDGFGGTQGLGGAHVNGLTVSETGEVIVSSLNFDALIGIDGDPASPTFLQTNWNAAGAPGGGSDLPNPEFGPRSGVMFNAQHNGSRHGDELWVFDNNSRADPRALRMQMNLATGELTEIDSWSLQGASCNNQGGALRIDGGALVTCANNGDVFAFRDGANQPDWELEAYCGRPGSASTRAYPVTID